MNNITFKKVFKQFSEKGYKHYTENTVEELDELPLDSSDIITEFAHLREWLRINHGIWVEVNLPLYNDFRFTIIDVNKKLLIKLSDEFYDFPQETYNAAFDYIRKNNLI
jgi:aromatic ring-opening dioxygenase catalytic subunit (LigB family)